MSRSRREQKKHKERVDKAQQWVEEANVCLPSTLGRRSLSEVLKLETISSILPYGRTSTWQQNCPKQLRALVNWLRLEGIEPIHPDKETVSGKILDQAHREVLHQQMKIAGEMGLYLLTLDSSRILRHPDYHQKWNTHLRPTLEQWKEVREWEEFYRTEILTVNEVNSSPPEGAVFIREFKKKYGGGAGRDEARHPNYFKERKEKYQSKVQEWRDEGISYRKIQQRLQEILPFTPSLDTIFRWASGG